MYKNDCFCRLLFCLLKTKTPIRFLIHYLILHAWNIVLKGWWKMPIFTHIRWPKRMSVHRLDILLHMAFKVVVYIPGTYFHTELWITVFCNKRRETTLFFVEKSVIWIIFGIGKHVKTIIVSAFSCTLIKYRFICNFVYSRQDIISKLNIFFTNPTHLSWHVDTHIYGICHWLFSKTFTHYLYVIYC